MKIGLINALINSAFKASVQRLESVEILQIKTGVCAPVLYYAMAIDQN